MSPAVRRVLLVARNESSFILRCLNYYLLLAVVLSVPLLLRKTGFNPLGHGRSEGGLWHNSQFAIAFQLALFGSFAYFLGLLDLAGKSWLRDGEDRMTDLLLASPLTHREYVWGKYLGLAGMTLVAAALHLILLVAMQILPHEQASLWGPASLRNYLVPFLMITVPVIFLMCSFLLWLAIRLDSMAGVQLAGFLLFSVGATMAAWRPDEISQAAKICLQVVDFSLTRWMFESFLQVDRGVTFYNFSAIAWDGVFWANRALLVFFTLGFVELGARSLGRRREGSGAAREKGATVSSSTAEGPGPSILNTLHMKPGRSLSTFWRIMLFEWKSVLGNRLFLVMLLIYTLGALFPLFLLKGPFGEPLRLTSGNAIGTWFSILTMYAVISLCFTLIESLFTEVKHGFSPLIRSTPAPAAAFVLSKIGCCAIFAVMLVLMVFAGSLVVQQTIGQARIDIAPYVLAFGLILPTLLFAGALVAFLGSLTGHRQATYILMVVYFMLIGQAQLSGELTWVGNLLMSGVWKWSDMIGLEGWWRPLILNRFLYICASLPLIYVAVALAGRQEPDQTHPIRLLRWVKDRQKSLPVALLVIPCLILAVALYRDMSHSLEGEPVREWYKEYYLENAETWRNAPLPTMKEVHVALHLMPEERFYSVSWQMRLRNENETALRRFPITMGPNMVPSAWSLDGEAIDPARDGGLYQIVLEDPLQPGKETVLSIQYTATLHRFPSTTPGLGAMPRFVLDGAVYLNTGNSVNVFPIIGFLPLLEHLAPKRWHDDYWSGQNGSSYLPEPFLARIEVRLPRGYTVVAPGRKLPTKYQDRLQEVTFVTESPVKGLPILAGRYEVLTSGTDEVYFHPGHRYNVEKILKTLSGSRARFSHWYGEYPHRMLRLAEFPGIATFAESFSSVIGYSENLGFLSADAELDLLQVIVAHEVSHQWWGMLVTPADGPSLPILTESLAHYSALAYVEDVSGVKQRAMVSRFLERMYLTGRSSSSEKPLDQHPMGGGKDLFVVRYNKGSLAFWLLAHALGAETMRQVLTRFVLDYRESRDHPTLHDLLDRVQKAANKEQEFEVREIIRQMFTEVVLPSYNIQRVKVETRPGGYRTYVRVSNVGSGHFPLEVSLQWGASEVTRHTALAPHEVRSVLWIPTDDVREISIDTAFEPDRVVLDPDAVILQSNRDDRGIAPGDSRWVSPGPPGS